MCVLFHPIYLHVSWLIAYKCLAVFGCSRSKSANLPNKISKRPANGSPAIYFYLFVCSVETDDYFLLIPCHFQGWILENSRVWWVLSYVRASFAFRSPWNTMSKLWEPNHPTTSGNRDEESSVPSKCNGSKKAIRSFFFSDSCAESKDDVETVPVPKNRWCLVYVDPLLEEPHWWLLNKPKANLSLTKGGPHSHFFLSLSLFPFFLQFMTFPWFFFLETITKRF